MNFTVANHNQATNPSNFIHYDNVEFEDIPEMVTSGYCYCACKLKDNYRIDTNFDGHVDVLIIDVDDSCTIEQAQAIFSKYEYYIIPSKSHRIEKNGVVCDRFRIFFKLSETVYIREKMEAIYQGFINTYPFVDKKCKNVSRFFYSSPKDSNVIYNHGTTYKTNIAFADDGDTQKSTKTKKLTSDIPRGVYVLNELSGEWVNEFGEVLESEQENREENYLKGARTYLDDEFYSGNRNNACFSVACMLLKDGLDEDTIVKFLTDENEKRDSMKFNELMQCIRSAIRTI